MTSEFVSAFLTLVPVGLAAGILAGILGVGGGILMVPILVFMGLPAAKAVGTSSIAVLAASLSASIRNFRAGGTSWRLVFLLGLPAIPAAQLGAYAASEVADRVLVLAFALFLLVIIRLMFLRRSMGKRELQMQGKGLPTQAERFSSRVGVHLGIGATGGALAGFFGLGGGVILVPLLTLFGRHSMKTAVKLSLGSVLITAMSACSMHIYKGNVWWAHALGLSAGSLVGAQIGAMLLPRFSDKAVARSFVVLLVALSLSMFAKGLWP